MLTKKKLLDSIKIAVIFLLPLLLIACSGHDYHEDYDPVRVNERMNSPEGCFLCHLFKVTYNAVGRFSSQLYPSLCPYALTLLALGTIFWLLRQFLPLFISPREPNLPSLWTGVIKKIFLVGFVAILVRSPNGILFVVNNFLEPIEQFIISFSEMVLQANWTHHSLDVAFSRGIDNNVAFSSSVGLQLENLVYNIITALNKGWLLGLSLMFSGGILDFVLGLLTLAIVGLLMLCFPLFFIDGIVRLAFVFVLLPFFLVCYCFRSTASYAQKALAILIGALGQIFIACIFSALCVSVIDSFVSLNNLSVGNATVEDTNTSMSYASKRLGAPFLSFMFILVYIYRLAKRVPMIASYFTGAPSGSIFNTMMDRIKSFATAALATTIALGALATGNVGLAKYATNKAVNDLKQVKDPKK